MCYSWFPDLGHHLRSRLPIWYLCERWRSLFWIHIAPESSPCSHSFASEGVLLSAALFEAQMFTAIWDLDHGSRSGGHNTPEARGSGLNFTVNGRQGNSRGSYIQDTLMYKKRAFSMQWRHLDENVSALSGLAIGGHFGQEADLLLSALEIA